MLQILLVGVSIGLVILGVKGFTASGLALSKTKTLRGRPAMIVGSICIVAGLAFIPLFMLLVWSMAS